MVERLPGGAACDVLRLEIDRGGGPESVVLKTLRLASTFADIHAVATPQVPPSMRRAAIWHRWTPTDLPPAVADGVRSALARLAEPGGERGLCHGDFHPGNVLFGPSAVTGVVDSVSARWGPS